MNETIIFFIVCWPDWVIRKNINFISRKQKIITTSPRGTVLFAKEWMMHMSFLTSGEQWRYRNTELDVLFQSAWSTNFFIFLIDRLHSQLNLLTKRLKVNLFRDFTTFSIKAMKLFFHFWTSFWVTDYEEQWTYSVRHRHLFGRFWCFLKKNTGQYSRF